ncbi:MAG: hypothetical protein KDN19_04660 [Verrucomicrobiae bacterium]|nr:hypothetical protein [Verrucomicrobiae bacterium]
MEANDDKSPSKKEAEFDWFDRPESRRLLCKLLYAACAVSVIAEIPLFFLHKRHGHFGEHSVDGWIFFYASLGFIACSLMIIGAKWLGYLLKKPEDYYGEPGEKTLPEDIDESLR